jgi:hypothetical protein
MEHEDELLALLDELRVFEKHFGLGTRFNLFEAVNIVRQEIRHSSFLAFLLSPAEAHGLGDKFLRAVLVAAASNHPDPPVSRLGLAIADCSGALVYRERDHFDITVHIPELHMMFVIENKIDAAERPDQLLEYRDQAKARYAGTAFMGTFLTREGYAGEDDQWGTLSYATVASELSRIAEEQSPAPAVALAIEHYVALIERRIMVSPQLIDACRRIFVQHRVALDLIAEHGEVSVLSEGFTEFQKRHENLDAVITRSSSVHFVAKEWLSVPNFQVAEARWSTTCPVKFWFRQNPRKLFLRLEVGPVIAGSSFDREAYVQELRKRVKGNEREVKPLFTRIRTHSRALSEEPDADEMAVAMEELWVNIGASDAIGAVLASIPAGSPASRSK